MSAGSQLPETFQSSAFYVISNYLSSMFVFVNIIKLYKDASVHIKRILTLDRSLVKYSPPSHRGQQIHILTMIWCNLSFYYI